MLRPHAAGLCLALLGGVVGSAQQITPVQVLKIAAGPSGAESNGVFALTEERSVFSRTKDREVIVFFQWEDVPGPHKLVAQWRSSDGGTTASSAIDYNARDKRFGAYWRLPVTSDMPLGVWSVEATMDGRPAGRYTFEITDAVVKAAVSRRPLTPAELYERLNPLFVVVRRGTSDGKELEPAGGFLASPQTGHIHTIVAALDAADTLRAVAADGAAHPITHLLAWTRPEQWAIVRGQPRTGEPLGIAERGRVKVGSHCFSLEGTAAGTRVLIGGTLSGHATAGGRQVLLATFPGGAGMPGAPIVDEYGDLLGIIGAGLPGDQRPVDYIIETRGAMNGGAPIIPFVSIAADSAPAASEVAVLRASGELMPSLTGTIHIGLAGFTRAPVKRAETATPEFVKEFSIRDPIIGVYVTWIPSERIRGNAVLRLIDSENRIIATSQPRKVNFNKGDFSRTSWEMPMLTSAGDYRVDVSVDARTFWRGFFRVNP